MRPRAEHKDALRVRRRASLLCFWSRRGDSNPCGGCPSLGAAYDDQDLIFPAPNGAPMNPRVLSRKFSRFRKRHSDAAAAGGAEGTGARAAEQRIDLRWHDWRHSYAAQQLRAGEQVLVVSRALGHATAAFTLDVYGHVLPGEQQAAAQRHGERIDAARARGRAAAEVR